MRETSQPASLSSYNPQEDIVSLLIDGIDDSEVGATKRWKRTNPIYDLLQSRTALQNSPELIDLIGHQTAAQLLMQLAYWQKVHGNTAGWFFRKQSELAAELRVSESTIRRAQKRLESLGVLKVKRHRYSSKKSKSGNHYRVDLARLGELLDQQSAKFALEATPRVSEELDADFGKYTPADQPVKADDSINKKAHRSVQRRRKAGKEKCPGCSCPHCPSKRQRPAKKVWFPEDVDIDPVQWQLAGLCEDGYDDDFNPADPRLPEPGEPERIAREKYAHIPNDVLTWLGTEGMKGPVQDIRTAVARADKEVPVNVKALVEKIRKQRNYQEYTKKFPGKVMPSRWE